MKLLVNRINSNFRIFPRTPNGGSFAFYFRVFPKFISPHLMISRLESIASALIYAANVFHLIIFLVSNEEELHFN